MLKHLLDIDKQPFGHRSLTSTVNTLRTHVFSMSDSWRAHVACQAPLSLGFSRQESWSGLPFPPPERTHSAWTKLIIYLALNTRQLC